MHIHHFFGGKRAVSYKRSACGKPDNLNPTKGKIPKYNYDRADWQQFQNSLSYDFHSIISKKITLKTFTPISQKSY